MHFHSPETVVTLSAISTRIFVFASMAYHMFLQAFRKLETFLTNVTFMFKLCMSLLLLPFGIKSLICFFAVLASKSECWVLVLYMKILFTLCFIPFLAHWAFENPVLLFLPFDYKLFNI